MENNPDKTDPASADDRLMDALLREHARLGSRPDETFLAELNQAMLREKPAAETQPPKNKKLILWPWLAGATATAAAVALTMVAIGPVEQRVHRTVAENPPSAPSLVNPTPKPPSVVGTLPSPKSEKSESPIIAFQVPPVELPTSPPVTSLPGSIRGQGQGIGEGFGSGLGGSSRTSGYPSRNAPNDSHSLAKVSPGAVNRRESALPSDKRGERGPVDRERYGQLLDNPWRSPVDEALSTFSIDVDTASYSNFRRLVQSGQRVPADSIRLEEMVNYFDYEYSQPKEGQPFGVSVDAAVTPWNTETRLVRVALQGREVERLKRPAANLVFLMDVSGSMSSPDKLPLALQSFGLLLEELNAEDTLSIVVYAGSEGLAVSPTRCDPEGIKRISEALNRLQSGGSTNGGAGITLAYKLARENFKPGGINRVILATDGDFNVGVTGNGDLVSLVEREAKSKVFLTVLGFGTGNLNDSMMEAITNKGNGTYHYIDSLSEGRRVFLQKMMGTLLTIAKDVKIQVEFNPAQVAEYRLLGYANRMLNKEDFNNDRVDAGDIGAGHTVTAFYEIRPGPAKPVVDALKYGPKTGEPPAPTVSVSNEWLTVKLRYKEPEGDTSKLLSQPFAPGKVAELSKASADFRFATAVALTASVLRETGALGTATLHQARELASGAKGADPHGHRTEFIALLDRLIRQNGLHEK